MFFFLFTTIRDQIHQIRRRRRRRRIRELERENARLARELRKVEELGRIWASVEIDEEDQPRAPGQ